MSITNPFFSIIIPTYNRALLIGKTIESVLSQTFTSYEIIVIDDGGKDQTQEVIKSFKNETIKYFWKENGERGAARNFGWRRSSGSYVTFLDSDDIFYSDHLINAFNFISCNKVVCYAQAYEVKNGATNKILVNGFVAKDKVINNQLLKGNVLSCFGVFLKRDIIEELSFEEDRCFAGTEDWLLWLQLAARYPFFYNNLVTGALMEHENRSVLSFKEESLVFRTEFLRKKLENDPVFVKKFGYKTIRRIFAHMLSYTSLHLAISKKRNDALKYLLKAVKINTNELLSRRTLAITKKILYL